MKLIDIIKNFFAIDSIPPDKEEKKEINIDYPSMFNSFAKGLIIFDADGRIIARNHNAGIFLNILKNSNSFNEVTKILNLNILREELIYLSNQSQKQFFVTSGERYLQLQFSSDDDARIFLVVSDFSKERRLDDRKRDFVANVSHELKTPLTSIMSYSEALLDPDLPAEMRNKFLNVVISESERMDRLIGDLLQLSKLSSDKVPLNKRRYSFALLINNCIEKIRLEADNHKVTIKTYFYGDLPEVMMDVDKIEQVILNILSNSIKYTPEKGTITLYAGKTFSKVFAMISDNGIGIPKEYVGMVFERFYRVDKARNRQQGGTGLGLAICKEILDAHMGEINLSSEFGRGTDVLIKLPIKSTKSTKF